MTGAYCPARTARAGPLKDRHYYRERAAYLRRLAKEAQTEALRLSCLKAAEEYEAQAMDTEQANAN